MERLQEEYHRNGSMKLNRRQHITSLNTLFELKSTELEIIVQKCLKIWYNINIKRVGNGSSS